MPQWAGFLTVPIPGQGGKCGEAAISRATRTEAPGQLGNRSSTEKSDFGVEACDLKAILFLLPLFLGDFLVFGVFQ